MRFVRAGLVAGALVSLIIPAAAETPASGTTSAAPATATPDVATLLFSDPQWGQAPAGSVLTYDYAAKTDPKYGPTFDDHVVLTLEKGDDADSRVVEVKLFSGSNARPAGPFRSTRQNPVLLLVLEKNVEELSKVFKANPRYLKNAIRKAWRDKAQISPAQITVGGKTVAGTRITVQPFLNDSESDRMQGLDTMTYTVEVADGVPGNIATIDIHAPATGPAAFSETLHFASVKTP